MGNVRYMTKSDGEDQWEFRREMLVKAIIGIVMTVDTIEGSFKLNQHKSDVDHSAIANALALQADPDAQQLARIMREMRPQAFATETVQSEGTQ